VSFEYGTITIARTKNGETVTIPIAPRLLQELKTLYSERMQGSEYVFDLPYVYPGHKIYMEFKRIMRLLGKPEHRFHDLRHTFASILVQQGCSLYSVSQLLGHKSLSMSARYSHLSLESKRETIKKLDILNGQ